LVAVHDEINVAAAEGDCQREMAVLRESMEAVPLDVLLLTEGSRGRSWGELNDV
jgi:hypothetical protein